MIFKAGGIGYEVDLMLILFDLQVEFLVRGKSSFVDLLFLHHCIFWKESVPYHIVNVIHPLNGFNR